MPCESAVLKWLNDFPDFAVQYSRARAMLMERWSDEILDIAANEPDVNRARLQVDTRRWLMSKLAPKRYGDKLTVSGDADGPVRLVCEWKAPALAALTKPEDEDEA